MADNNEKETAKKELTMLLLYLSQHHETGRCANPDDIFSWKGYDFEILNDLEQAECIWQGEAPSRSKKVYLTDTGIDYAKSLLKKYGLEDESR